MNGKSETKHNCSINQWGIILQQRNKKQIDSYTYIDKNRRSNNISSLFLPEWRMIEIVFTHSLWNLIRCSVWIAIRILLSIIELRLSVIRIWLSIVWTLVWHRSRCTAVRAGSEVIRILCSAWLTLHKMSPTFVFIILYKVMQMYCIQVVDRKKWFDSPKLEYLIRAVRSTWISSDNRQSRYMEVPASRRWAWMRICGGCQIKQKINQNS